MAVGLLALGIPKSPVLKRDRKREDGGKVSWGLRERARSRAPRASGGGAGVGVTQGEP